MNRRSSILAVTVALVASGDLWSSQAVAADPTTADCLGASEAAFKSGSDRKLRIERSQLLVCAAPSCPADVRKECVRRVDEVNAAIPTILFEAKDGSGADISTVKVTMDGEVLAERLEGTALSIDPGEHTFTFETAGQPAVTRKLVIQEAQKERRELVTFGANEAGATPSIATTAQPTFVVPPAESGSTGMGTQKMLALVAGGIGVVGLGVGTAFGLVSLSKKSDAQDACPNQCSSPDGVNKWSSAVSTGNVSTVALIVGGVGVAGAAVLWFTAPRRMSSAAQVGLGPSGLQVKETW